MEGPYQLVNALHVHDGPVRSVVFGPNGECITGSQSDSPCVRRWKIQDSIEETGTPLYHDHWVTAVTSLSPDISRSYYPQGCIVSGCMDSKIRIFDENGVLGGTLEGHAKGIISFSWTVTGLLISGSWDGTAKLWDLESNTCVQTLQPHENGVHVLGLSNSLVATTSTGESVDGKPANFKLRIWDPSTGKTVGTPIADHSGSIRAITSLPGINGFATSANDGTVMLRSIDGELLGTVFHAPQEDGSPPFILDCCSLDFTRDSGAMDSVSCGEDGSVMVWNGTEAVQSIPHPTSVWCVAAVPGGSPGDFVTGGHDGVLRYFSRDADRINSSPVAAQLSFDFLSEVAEAQQRKRKGPSSEELAKAPRWEDRGQHPGSSENQVMVFNKDGTMIAGQWNSGAWIIIGEVTGSGDGGYVGDVWFDHVMPVEIEGPRGLRSLKLGHNNGENPFVAAQRFIDANQLEQSYLAQIADWITARAGHSTPTLDAPTAGGSSVGAPSARTNPTPPVPPPVRRAPSSSFSLRLTTYLTVEDVPAAAKLFSKVLELNGVTTVAPLSERELELVQSSLATLSDTSHYHSSQISPEQVKAAVKMATQWEASNVFPAYDVLRLIAVHPAGSESLATVLSRDSSLLVAVLGLLNNAAAPHTSALTGGRFVSNLFKATSLRTLLLNFGTDKVITAIAQLQRSPNKNVRVSAATIAVNLAASTSSSPKGLSAEHRRSLLEASLELIRSERESSDVIFRAATAIGTLLVNVFSSSDRSDLVQGISVTDTLQQVAEVWSAAKLGETAARCLQEVRQLAAN